VLPAQQSPGLTLNEVLGDKISEDPIDLLQRTDDFNQILNGLKLTHLRDTLSMESGWSIYLLKFDISLLPGDATQEEYGAHVAFQIQEPKNQIRVYSVWPQRYADRFQEVSSTRDDFRLALQGAAQGTEWAANIAQDLAQRYEEDLAMIQRYPLISGFTDGNANTFGWEFNPRLRIVTKDWHWPLTDKQEHVYWLEPGLRQVYALLAVRDCRVEVKKKLLILSPTSLGAILKGKGLYTLEELKHEYINIEKEYAAPECEPVDTSEANPSNKDSRQYQDELQRQFKKLDKFMEDEQRLTQEIELKKQRPAALLAVAKLNDEVRALQKQELQKLTTLHKYALNSRIGRQGALGLTRLTLKVRRTWFNRKNGYTVPPEQDVLLTAQSNASAVHSQSDDLVLNVSLPDKLDRTLWQLSTVIPDRGSIDEPTKVTIRGQNFSNDARVFVAGHEATDVEVLGRDFLTATFPKIDEQLLEGAKKKKFTVTVFTGGDPLQSRDAFTYVASKAVPPAPFKVERIVPTTEEGGRLINIIANKPVMDNVAKVFFGTYEVHSNNMLPGDDKKHLWVIVPQDEQHKIPASGTDVFVVLHFKPEAKVTEDNTYKFSTPFRYK
jgi:hypothetical protein